LCFLGAIWPLLSVVKNLIFINYAKEQLRRRFRALVTEGPVWAADAELLSQVSSRLPAHPLPPVLPK
jgi:hypothetical protein